MGMVALPQRIASAYVVVCGGYGDVTPLFSLHENAIAKEPGARYPERWRCVSRLGAPMVAQTPASPPRM
jgi:hypothetical protein